MGAYVVERVSCKFMVHKGLRDPSTAKRSHYELAPDRVKGQCCTRKLYILPSAVAQANNYLTQLYYLQYGIDDNNTRTFSVFLASKNMFL